MVLLNQMIFLFIALSIVLHGKFISSFQVLNKSNGGPKCGTRTVPPTIVAHPSSYLTAETAQQQHESDPQRPSQLSKYQTEISNNVSSEMLLDRNQQIRKVERIEKFARLPVWPAWNGVVIWLVGNIFGNEIAARLESIITGRVCPNFFNYLDTSPYVMLVHHCHTFSALDPLRYIQRTFFPEGFPAHPHRGFVTITYILHGGFVHRDSEGVYQKYGDATSDIRQQDTYNGKHTQWLTTGRGMLHEEMFDIETDIRLGQVNSRQELYQIWLNVPARHKMDEPRSVLLGGNDDTPVVYDENGKAKTLILAGTYAGKTSIAPVVTDLVLFHVTLQPGITWKFNLPSALYETAFIYVRQGSLRSMGTGDSNSSIDENTVIQIPVHHTAYFEKMDGGDGIVVTAGEEGVADFMFLAGVPIKEPCYASGSMVMNYPNEIEEAYNDYQKGLFGIPWDYKLSDVEWKQHVLKTRKTR
jgi:redox-sensitive bicupin YhaK (pirin superfamily)